MNSNLGKFRAFRETSGPGPPCQGGWSSGRGQGAAPAPPWAVFVRLLRGRWRIRVARGDS